MKRDILGVNQLKKSFDRETAAVAGVSFSLNRGQILCLLGPSGCGKTTLLRLIAGLETPDEGSILFDGQDLAGVPPHKRNFGLMFQEFALFPHKNVGQNVAFGLQNKKETEAAARVEQMLALVGLSGFEERDVNSLSGGERQRVALARSLAPSPRLLMLDEPLGSLDRALRERLMLEIRQILKQVELAAIYVTHDHAEAFAVADRVIVMNQGRLEQEASPEQLYRQPATPFVAGFLGFPNLLEATCLSHERVETALGVWPVAAADCDAGQKVTLLIRPEAASLTPNRGILLKGECIAALFRGRFYQVTLAVSGQHLTFELPLAELPLPPGQTLTVWLDPAAILVLGKR
ncbi:MAG: ABC transporter ATP-binding protein [Anaerolineae bacterium]|nr:ABC transporter ATP-binding protein [Anaerolineae bacterium]